MTQNIYDNPEFFEGYSRLGRSVEGLAGAAEWPSLRAMLPDVRGLRVVDLGCGYGPIGLTLAKLAPKGEVHLVDKDYLAIEFTLKNAQANHLDNVKAYLSNGLSNVPAGQKFDIIVSNVPAKIGTELLQIFLHDAHEHLNPGGKLYIVTVSGLKEYMKRHLTGVFGNYDKLKQSKTYTAAVAVR